MTQSSQGWRSAIKWIRLLVGGVLLIGVGVRSAHFTYGAARTSPLPVTFVDILIGIGFYLAVAAVLLFAAGSEFRRWRECRSAGSVGAAHLAGAADHPSPSHAPKE